MQIGCLHQDLNLGVSSSVSKVHRLQAIRAFASQPFLRRAATRVGQRQLMTRHCVLARFLQGGKVDPVTWTHP